eukprot:6207383-Pleurochrysis_carterae.AAC.4
MAEKKSVDRQLPYTPHQRGWRLPHTPHLRRSSCSPCERHECDRTRESRQRKAPGCERQTAQGARLREGNSACAGLREGNSAMRRAARGEQRKAAGYERGTAQGAGLREDNSARHRTSRVACTCI